MNTALSAVCLLLIASQQPSDPIGENLFPPELLMQHQQAIGLTEEQKTLVRTEIQKLQVRALDLQFQLQGEVEKMAALTKQNRVDERQALAQLERILDLEEEIKRAHFLAIIRIKNALTPEQQARLQEIKKRLPSPG